MWWNHIRLRHRNIIMQLASTWPEKSGVISALIIMYHSFSKWGQKYQWLIVVVIMLFYVQHKTKLLAWYINPKLGLILVNLRCRNPITKIVLRATNSSVCFYTANKKVRAKHYNGLQLRVLRSSHAFFLLNLFINRKCTLE